MAWPPVSSHASEKLEPGAIGARDPQVSGQSRRTVASLARNEAS